MATSGTGRAPWQMPTTWEREDVKVYELQGAHMAGWWLAAFPSDTVLRTLEVLTPRRSSAYSRSDDVWCWFPEGQAFWCANWVLRKLCEKIPAIAEARRATTSQPYEILYPARFQWTDLEVTF